MEPHPVTGEDVAKALRTLSEGGSDPLGGFLDAARRLCRAPYAALSVAADTAGEPPVIEHFFATGVEGTVDMGPPGGSGVLAELLTGSPVRTSDVRAHPLFGGFPAGHPELGPMLGIPLGDTGGTIGILCVARRPGAAPFSDDEELLLCLLGAAAVPAVRRMGAHGAETGAALPTKIAHLLCKEVLADLDAGRADVAIHNLRGYLTSEGTHSAPLSSRLHRIFDLYSRDPPTVSELGATGDIDTALTRGEEELLLAAVREVFVETLRVPGTHRVRVTVDAGRHGVAVQICVQNDSPPASGLGSPLADLAEEAGRLGGSLRLSQAGEPYRLVATFPGRQHVRHPELDAVGVPRREHVYGNIGT